MSAPNVGSAIHHLIEYLKREQRRGKNRVFLAPESRSQLRGMIMAAREARRQGRSILEETPPAVESPVAPETAPPPSAPTIENDAAPAPTAAENLPTGECAYPEIPAASARLVLTPIGETKKEKLADLQVRIGKDPAVRLDSLRDTLVFSTGDPDAEIMLIGEAPGFEEERQREPFVGPAGRLLTKILGVMGLPRESVYISNIVKFRPAVPNQGTGNRKPEKAEMEACLPYILAEIATVNPKVIVALGGTALEGLTGQAMPVSRARGALRSWNGIPFLATYHPSYLLHNPSLSERRKVWEDMLLVMEDLGMPITEKQRGFFLKR